MSLLSFITKIIIFEIRSRKSVGGFDEKHLIKLGLSQSNSHSTFAVSKIMVLKSAAGRKLDQIQQKAFDKARAESKQFIYTHIVSKIIIFEIRCRKGIGGFDEKHLIKLG